MILMGIKKDVKAFRNTFLGVWAIAVIGAGTTSTIIIYKLSKIQKKLR
jgi:hypothetical protein